MHKNKSFGKAKNIEAHYAREPENYLKKDK